MKSMDEGSELSIFGALHPSQSRLNLNDNWKNNRFDKMQDDPFKTHTKNGKSNHLCISNFDAEHSHSIKTAFDVR